MSDTIKQIKTEQGNFYPLTVATAVKDPNFTNDSNQPMNQSEINAYLNEKIKLLDNPDDSHPDQIYGVVHYYENASPILTRIGNLDLHKSLPIQSLMKRCLVTDDGQVTYLHPENSNLLENGQQATLDGSQGLVMVEIPEHWRKFTLHTVNKTYTCEISLFQFEGAHKINKCYISAYEAALDRTDLKLSSVVNNTARYRGGDNSSSWDNTYRSLLGRPVTLFNLANFRLYANNRGSNWKCLEWDIYTTVFWLYTVEYANLNCQATYNTNLTNEGYKQGGLGSGVTGMSNWGSYNNLLPFIPCGITNSLGNYTGIVIYKVPNSNGTINYNAPVPSYRGIENPFGHVWKLVDGVLCKGLNSNKYYYVCRMRNHYDSTLNGSYTNIGVSPTTDDYTKSIIRNLYGDILSTETGGSDSTYFCAQLWSAPFNEATYAVYSGGGSHYNGQAGLCSFALDISIDLGYYHISTRLCFCTKERIIE